MRISTLESSNTVLDSKLNSLESADSFLQEAHRILTEKTALLENEIKQHSGNGANLSEKLDKVVGTVEILSNDYNVIKAEFGIITGKLNDHEVRTSDLETMGHKNNENIERVAQALQSINQQINFLESNASTTWESVEIKLENCQKEIANLSSGLTEKSDALGNLNKEMEYWKSVNAQLTANSDLQKNEILQLQDVLKGNEKALEDFHGFQDKIYHELSDIHGKLGNYQAKVEDLDKDQLDLKGIFEKQDHMIKKFTTDFQQLTLGHSEMGEKVHEVQLLVNNMEAHLRNSEEKLEKQLTADLENVLGRLSKLDSSLGTLDIKIEDLDSKGQKQVTRLQSEKTELDNRIKGLSETNQSLAGRIDQIESAHIKKLNNLDDLLQEHDGKIRLLEEASMKHYEHAQYVENLNNRLIQIDEARQQSEAQARDEVDGTFNQYKIQINNIKVELEEKILNIENILKQLQEYDAQTTANLQKHIEELNFKEALHEQNLENLKKGLQNTAEKNSMLQADFQEKLNEIRGSANITNQKVLDLENEQKAYVERLVSFQETTMIAVYCSLEIFNKIQI
jgi:chromosome segregation ATPase